MILWFSGTGNSRQVAMLLAAELRQQIRELAPGICDHALQLPEGDKTVVWVCPVYSWGLPPYVRYIIRTINIENGGDISHHLVLTCGDDCGLTPEMWRKDMAARGMDTGLTFSVTMPNNYVCMKGFDVDPEKIRDAKLAAAPRRVRQIAGVIAAAGAAERRNDVVRGHFAWIKTHIIYPWFVRHAMSPEPFRFTDACISCGKCAAACPLDNITMTHESDDSPRRRPHWGDRCAGCLACYHVCPRHAVMYGNATIHKGQYRNPYA